jgi:hypothetical protein
LLIGILFADSLLVWLEFFNDYNIYIFSFSVYALLNIIYFRYPSPSIKMPMKKIITKTRTYPPTDFDSILIKIRKYNNKKWFFYVIKLTFPIKRHNQNLSRNTYTSSSSSCRPFSYHENYYYPYSYQTYLWMSQVLQNL